MKSRIILILILLFRIMELKSQDIQTSKNIKFSVKSDKVYFTNKPIQIKLIWENKSNKPEKILFQDTPPPFGVGASIKDVDNKELTLYKSVHYLSSKIYKSEELRKYETTLKPYEIKEYTIDLLKIPHFKNNARLTEGRYNVQIFYYSKKSSDFEIEIKNEE